jgi:hypothetical protein
MMNFMVGISFYPDDPLRTPGSTRPPEEFFEFRKCAESFRRRAMQEEKLAVLQQALDEGIAELDAALGVETTPDDLMTEISDELGLDS